MGAYACSACHDVSTHSRLKAAGAAVKVLLQTQGGFNTQPPEGGWLTNGYGTKQPLGWVSTHSRLKAAGSS